METISYVWSDIPPTVVPVRIIDCQTHLHCRTYFEAHVGRPDWPTAERNGDGYVFHTSDGNSNQVPPHYYEIEQQLDQANRDGVDVVVSSMGAFTVDHLPVRQATELAMHLNEERAELEREHAGRYYALAILPLQDASAAIQTLDHAVEKLALRGVCIGSNIMGESIADRSLWPVYRRIAELGVPLFLHPTRSVMENRIRRHGHEYTVGFMVDTSFAALDLIFSGVLDEYPALRVVHPHGGGVLPYLAGRIEEEHSKEWSHGDTVPQPISEYLKRFYTDSVTGSPESLAFSIDTYGLDHMLFSSDYPYWSARQGLELIRRNLPEASHEQVLSGNAAALLGI